MVQVVAGRFWAWSPLASKTMARLTDGAVARRSQREPRVGAHRTPAHLARAGRSSVQGELVVANVPSSMERSVRSIPGFRSRSFTDFRRGGRRGVFIGQACLKSRAQPIIHARRSRPWRESAGPAGASPTATISLNAALRAAPALGLRRETAERRRENLRGLGAWLLPPPHPCRGCHRRAQRVGHRRAAVQLGLEAKPALARFVRGRCVREAGRRPTRLPPPATPLHRGSRRPDASRAGSHPVPSRPARSHRGRRRPDLAPLVLPRTGRPASCVSGPQAQTELLDA